MKPDNVSLYILLSFDSFIHCRVFLVLILAALGVFFGLDTAKQPIRFVSLAGLFCNILFCWIFSKHRRKVGVLVHLLCFRCQTSSTANLVHVDLSSMQHHPKCKSQLK